MLIDKSLWEESEQKLLEFCSVNLKYSDQYKEIFVTLWVARLIEMFESNRLQDALTIFIKLYALIERNEQIKILAKKIFEKHELETLFSFVLKSESLILTTAFCEYKKEVGELEVSQRLACANIQEMSVLLRDRENINLGWQLIRICLSCCEETRVGREVILQLIENLEN